MSVGLTLESMDSGSDSRSVVSSSALDKLEFELELEQETYRMIEFEATTTPAAAAAASSDMGHDGDKSSESDSICTTVVQPPPLQRAGEFESQAGIGESLAPDHLPQLTRSTASDDQILSARNLIFGARRNESEDGEEIYHEIELSDERPVAARLFDANQLRAGEMFATYRQQDEDLHPDALASQRQQQQQQKPAPGMHQFRCNGGGVGGGFCEAQPKITFASRRVKEYFKSFKSHKGETVRLYQFFKSTRTELVACLLFSLITSQALIVLRTHLIDEGAAAAGATWPLLNPSTRRQLEALQDNIEPPARHTKESQQTFHEQQQQQQQHHHLYHQRGQISNSNGRPAAPHGNGSPGSGRPASVQLANGLVMAFTVASLTQIFGHISGCHLIPSVSLALYVKGHISRARLASYLAAQLLGSALGVSLLSLLSSSQLTPADYRDLLVQPAGSSAMTARYQQQQQRPWSSQLAATDSVKLLAPSRRRRRDAVFEPQKIDNNNATASDHDEPRGSPGGSETILLSIMEQLERQQRPSSGGQVAHRRQQQQLASGEQPTSTIANEDYDDKRRVAPAAPITTSSGPGLEQETITVNVNTFPSDNLERRQQINLVEAPRAPPESSSSSSSSSSLETRAPASSAAATTTTAATMITTTIADDTTTTPRTVEVVAAGTSSSLPASSLLSDAAAAAGWNYSEPVEVARIRSGNEPPPPSFFNDRSRVVSPAIVAEPQAYGDGQQQQQHSDTIERLSVKAAAANNNDSSALADRGPWSGSAGDSPQPESTGQIATADSTSVASSRRPKLRRRKRNRQHLSAPSAVTQPPSVATTDNDATEKAPPQFSSSGSGNHERLLLLAHDRKSSDHYINLLEFTLPDQIMSSESIRQCIDKQLASAALATNQSFGATGTGSEQQQLVASAASNSFHRCISLSNSSQMFVFQFVATLLVVLAYLVNVDPRRVDPGFKSLSIGLSYFVASVVTIQSGGFYANPFQLIFLSWLSSTSEWQPEWFIYLITPLIGGLFGAISHEYIDFSSLRNRNKRLHLRRSFYSLDQLASGQQLDSTPMACRQQQPQPKPPQNVNASETQHAAAAAVAADSSRLTCPGAVGSARQLSSGSSLESAGASSSVLSLSSQHELQQAASCEQVTSHSRPQHQGSSSLAASHPQPQPQPRTVVAMPSTGAECFNGATTSRKLARYPRHHHRANYRSNGHLTSGSSSSPPPPSMMMMISKHEQADVTSLRRSDFDSNFLISSTTATQASSSSSPSPPPPATASRRQGAQQTTTNSNWM